MIYKDFIAEAAEKIMAAAIADKNANSLTADNEELKQYIVKDETIRLICPVCRL